MNNRKFILNESYFDIIDTENKAYWLGFLYADGAISKYYTCLHLKLSDISHLKKFRKELYLKKFPIINVNTNKSALIRISSKKISESLINLGCMPSKSLILEFPNETKVPQHLIKHFIRGYFDGDGSITISGKRFIVSIIGTFKFIEGLQKQFLKLGIKETKIQKDRMIYKIVISSIKDMHTILNWMYQDSKIFLNRKKDRFEQFLLQDFVNDKNLYKKKTSNYKNICFDKSRNKWMISFNKKFIGRTDTEEDAVYILTNYKNSIGLSLNE